MFNVPKKSHAKYELSTSEVKGVIKYHCSYYDILVAVAVKYVVDAIVPKKLNANYELYTI